VNIPKRKKKKKIEKTMNSGFMPGNLKLNLLKLPPTPKIELSQLTVTS
jgi:hypothetical protein